MHCNCNVLKLLQVEGHLSYWYRNKYKLSRWYWCYSTELLPWTTLRCRWSMLHFWLGKYRLCIGMYSNFLNLGKEFITELTNVRICSTLAGFNWSCVQCFRTLRKVVLSENCSYLIPLQISVFLFFHFAIILLYFVYHGILSLLSVIMMDTFWWHIDVEDMPLCRTDHSVCFWQNVRTSPQYLFCLALKFQFHTNTITTIVFYRRWDQEYAWVCIVRMNLVSV